MSIGELFRQWRTLTVHLGLFGLGMAVLHAFPDLVAGESAPISAERAMMVIKDDAALGIDDRVSVRAKIGETFRVGRANGRFLWVPTRRAWIQREDVMPLDQAVRHFTKEIAESPNALAYHRRGVAFATQGKDDLAVSDLDQAIRLDPSAGGAYVNRGNIWRKRGEFDRAMADYDKAVQLDPDNAVACNNRGMVWMDRKEFDKAIADFNRAITINPQHASALNNRGVSWREKGEYRKAIEDYEAAIRVDPRYAAAYGNRGFAWKQLEDYAKAVADYDEAIRLDPQSAVACNDLAWLLATCRDAKFRDGQKAVELATKACKMTAFRIGTYLDTLAAACAETGNFQDAVKWAKQCLQKAPENERSGIQRRLELYEKGKPFRDEPKPTS